MVNRDAERINRIVCEALNQTGNRGVMLSGWGKAGGQSTGNLLFLDAVPHDWLLSRCKMIVHHGGAGTTSAGLRPGIPNIAIPFTADQPFWGRRVHAVGAGPKPIFVKSLSVENLVQAIVEADDETVCKHAEAIGQRIRSEDEVKRAVNLIEPYSSNWENFKVQMSDDY